MTGATGFVGRNVVRRLLARGYKVISVTTNKAVSDESKKFLIGSELVWVDSLETIPECVMHGNCIIHCAWNNVRNPTDISHYMHCAEQMKFILKMASAKPQKIIITGTCYEFGLRAGAVSVDDKTDPNTPYGQTKNFIKEMAFEVLRDVAHIKLVWARLFYVYGSGQHEESFYSQLISALDSNLESFNMSGGEQLYDYMKIDEASDKLVFLVGVDAPPVVHICNGYPTSLRSLADQIVREHRSNLRLNLGFYPYRKYESIALWGKESFDMQLSNAVINNN